MASGYVILAYAFFVFLTPIGTAVQFGADEHFELNKATAVLAGEQLYRDFWNDQPPLLTYILAGLFAVVGESILPARLLVAVLTALALGIMQRVWKDSPEKGWFFAVMLIGAPGYLGYSISVMPDPVKISMCVMAYGLLIVALRQGSAVLSGLAGSVFGLAVLVKLTALLYLPALLLGAWVMLREVPRKNRWAVVLAFLGGGCLWVPFLLGLVFRFEEQLLGAHFDDSFAVAGVFPGEFRFGWQHISTGTSLWVGGLIACVLVVVKRISLRAVAFPLTALATHLIFAFVHVPWWDYYQLDFWLILAWLSAEVLYCGVQLLRNWRFQSRGGRPAFAVKPAWLGIAIAGLVWFPLAAVLNVGNDILLFRKKPRIADSDIIAFLRNNPPNKGDVVFSNQPIVCFHGGWRPPPELVVLSLKRYWSTGLTEREVVTILQEADVDLVHFGGDLESIPGGYLKFAEQALGWSQRVGNGVVFTRE